MEWSDIFGDEAPTREQFEEKVAGMKLVDLTGGEYVGKGKLDAAIKARREAEAAADEARKALEGDDGLKKEVERLTAELAAKDKAVEEATRTAQEAVGKATRAERERMVRDKIADPKLARLALLDAEEMVSDEVDFDAALAKVIASDPDYSAEPVKQMKSGEPTKGKPESSIDPLAAAVMAKVGGSE